MTNAAVKSSLPRPGPLPPIDKILSSQMDVSIDMARHLESLASHYEQMAAALRGSEVGELFSEEDLQGNFGGDIHEPAALTAFISLSDE